MATPLELLKQLSEEHFQDVLAASPKKFREEFYRRAGIRAKSDAFSLKTSGKNEVRAGKLRAAIQSESGSGLEDEVAEEMIRNYLYTRRALLSDALDHFKVPHDNGLTDEDLSFIETLKPEQGQELRTLLTVKHEPRDVDLYLAFMNIPCA